MRRPVYVPKRKQRSQPAAHLWVARAAIWSHIAYYGNAAVHGSGLYFFLSLACVAALAAEAYMGRH